MKFLLIIAAFFSVSAFANNSELSVQMNTTSKAYVCNAGMKHNVAPLAQSCHIVDTTQACVAGEENCVCTGVAGNQYLKDFFSFSTAPFGSTSASPTQTINAGSTSFTTAHKDAASFENSVSNLTFKPSSDYSGATFFFDVCVRGPETKYFDETPASAKDVNFLLRSNIHRLSQDANGVPNITQDDEYADISKLNVRAVIHCDLQGLGANKFALDSTGAFNPRNSDIDWAAFANSQKGSSDFSFESKSILYEAGNNSLPDTMLITSSANRSQAPRFCVVRYEFTESVILDRSFVNFKNKLVLNFDAYPF